MGNREKYFDLALGTEVAITNEDFINSGGFTRFVPLDKWILFNKEEEVEIKRNVQTHYDYDGIRTIYYTVLTNTGAASYNTYNSLDYARKISAMNLYIDKRAGGEIN